MLAQQETGAATVLITHDLGVIAEMADRVVVMYAGKVVETAAVNEVFERPLHPYTEGLLASRPSLISQADELFQIAGSPPFMLGAMPSGCAFAPRCHRSRARQACVTDMPLLEEPDAGRGVACHFWSEAYQEAAR
jgi:oligopeptide/dipeptide ABC transporter ATP-binding protein